MLLLGISKISQMSASPQWGHQWFFSGLEEQKKKHWWQPIIPVIYFSSAWAAQDEELLSTSEWSSQVGNNQPLALTRSQSSFTIGNAHLLSTSTSQLLEILAASLLPSVMHSGFAGSVRTDRCSSSENTFSLASCCTFRGSVYDLLKLFRCRVLVLFG